KPAAGTSGVGPADDDGADVQPLDHGYHVPTEVLGDWNESRESQSELTGSPALANKESCPNPRPRKLSPRLFGGR
ncbi:hypothetical protein chiPu_0022746, partial [Chiloscyllium punctatum]|nr:hypothetical protein [Chiloscyllium punctatum]